MEKKNSLCEEDLQLRGGEVSTERWGSCHAGRSSHLLCSHLGGPGAVQHGSGSIIIQFCLSEQLAASNLLTQ